MSDQEKVKKPIYKKWWFWVGALVILFAIGSGGGNDGQQTAQTSAQTAQEQQKAEPQNKPSMTKAEFDQLKSGMSYEEASAIIGGPGEVISESGNPGDQLHTVMYQYEGEGDLGANANLMFQGNKLNNKAQFGLK